MTHLQFKNWIIISPTSNLYTVRYIVSGKYVFTIIKIYQKHQINQY